MQKWRLLGNFVLYMLPFLAGALYLGTVFLKAQQDLRPRLFRRPRRARACAGSPFLVAMYFVTPENLIVVPLVLWLAGSVLWFVGARRPRAASPGSAVAVAVASPCTSRCRRCSTSPSSRCPTTRASSYARKFPDSQRVYERASPFGYLEVYSSSYLHFAPGLSDNAAFNLPNDAGQRLSRPVHRRRGPERHHPRPAGRTRPPTYRFLPMIYPYLIKQAPDTFVVQFGGGISTAVALQQQLQARHRGGGQSRGARRRSATTRACATSPATSSTTPRSRVIDYDGRLYLAHTTNRYDVIDLSLADLGRPVEPRRLRHRREVLLHARGDERATCARSRTAASCRSRCGTRRSRPSRC